jgi:hypothetical protein
MDQNAPDTPQAGTDEARTIDEMAAAGDVRALLADMRAFPHLYGPEVAVRALRRALAASAATGDFARRADDAFALMLALTVDLLVFVQVPLMLRLDRSEQALTSGHESEARRLVEQGLPVVERLHAHLVDLLKAQATVRHTGAIGRGRTPGAAAATVTAGEDRRPQRVMRLVRETESLVDDATAPPSPPASAREGTAPAAPAARARKGGRRA